MSSCHFYDLWRHRGGGGLVLKTFLGLAVVKVAVVASSGDCARVGESSSSVGTCSVAQEDAAPRVAVHAAQQGDETWMFQNVLELDAQPQLAPFESRAPEPDASVDAEPVAMLVETSAPHGPPLHAPGWFHELMQRLAGQLLGEDIGVDGAKAANGNSSKQMEHEEPSTLHRLQVASTSESGGLFIFFMVGSLIALLVVVCFLIVNMSPQNADRDFDAYKRGGGPGRFRSGSRLGSRANTADERFLGGHTSASESQAPTRGDRYGYPNRAPTAGTLRSSPQSQVSMTGGQYSAYDAGASYYSDAALQGVATPPKMPKSLPPPLCTSLVLPGLEARFAVPLGELAALPEIRRLGVRSSAGEALLFVELREVAEGDMLEIRIAHPGSTPRATVGPPCGPSGGREIRGQGGVLYGLLEGQAGIHVVRRGAEELLQIDGLSQGLELRIVSKGEAVATVTCAEPGGDDECLEVRVMPGMDAVLALAVTLGVVALPAV